VIARRQFVIASGLLLTTARLPTEAQQPGKIYRIGFLRLSAPPDAYLKAFRQGLEEFGYIEGKNIAFEYRWAGGKADQLPALAAELVSLGVDVIVTDGAGAARPAQAATRTIPIVMASVGDPIGSGLIASLARPGGNVTGLTSMNLNLGGKMLDVLKDIVPKLAHVGILSLASEANDIFLKGTVIPAQALKIKVTSVLVRGKDYESAFRTATKERVQALAVGGTPQTSPADRTRIIDLATTNRLPAIYDTRDWAEHGGLVSYGADRLDMYRRAATYADRILKGARPADLPIEQPTKFELAINLQAAKKLGLTIPLSLLLRADKIVE